MKTVRGGFLDELLTRISFRAEEPDLIQLEKTSSYSDFSFIVLRCRMAKAQKESSTLVSSEGTNYVYINRKNKKKSKGDKKLKLRKYDPIARKHVVFEDKKLSALKRSYRLAKRDAAKGKKTAPAKAAEKA